MTATLTVCELCGRENTALHNLFYEGSTFAACPTCHAELGKRVVSVDGLKALRFETMVRIGGKPVLSTPLYQVRYRCRNVGCGMTFTGLSSIPQQPDDPARLRPCERCLDAAPDDRAALIATRHRWERQCICGYVTRKPRCPRCKTDMPAPPGRGFPPPRSCSQCHASEYLSVGGRVMLDCNHG